MPHRILAALSILGVVLFVAPADAQVAITQAKAIAGNVTPGDTAGFPVTLSAPGSYRLTTNLYPGPGLDGILVTSSDVAIDLNGFTISGGPAGGTNNARTGISGQGDRLTLRNGTIGAFKGYGINAAVHYVMIDGIRLVNNRVGIYNGLASFAKIQNSIVATSDSFGIACGSYCLITNNVVSGNSGSGVNCQGSCQIEGNLISSNGQEGVNINSGSVVDNTISQNGGFGVLASVTGTSLTGNTLLNNAGGQISGTIIGKNLNSCAPAC